MAPSSYWHQFQRQRISRRRVLAAVGARAAGLTVAAACGGGGEPDADGTPAAAGQPVRGGRYKFAISSDWATLDPVTSGASGPRIFPRMYKHLGGTIQVEA